ncbi:MAG: MG2 domain-containing protein [Alcaligenaceae bacterium]|nr:MG2 domain-containing protein [Alcaligenaceae bacterium]
MSKGFKSLFKQLVFTTTLGALTLSGVVNAQNMASVVSVVPSGEVARADFVRVTFNQPVMRLGADAADPFLIQCEHGVPRGSGKWSDNRVWQYDFATAISEPNNCVLTNNPDFKDLNGVALEESEYQFSTGKLTVRARPWPLSQDIAEDQHFILSFNSNVPAAQLEQFGYCAVEGVGERLPLKVLEATEVPAYLDTVWISGNPDWARIVHCGRRLPTGGEVAVVLEADLSTEYGHALAQRQRFDYVVREPFQGTFSCQRIKQGAPCLPLSDVKVRFNALVDSTKLKQIRLKVNAELRVPDGFGDSSNNEINMANELVFKGPFPERAELQLVVPEGFTDDLQRELSNLDSLSQNFTLDELPPLAKFAKQDFGIYELFQEGEQTLALIPVTQRRLAADQSAGPNYLDSLSTTNDADVIRWMRRFERLDENIVDVIALEDMMIDRKEIRWGDYETPEVDTRAISIFGVEQQGLEQIELPVLDLTLDGNAEVLGVPLAQSGFHVLELSSPTLAGSLLADHNDTMYVRTTALLTNLAVHMKYGPEDFLVWVTRLDTGEPVANATINISNCEAKPLHSGVTDQQGRLYLSQAVAKTPGCSYSNGGDFFVSARVDADHPAALGIPQYSFALSAWSDGIEPWRFNIDSYLYGESDTGRLVEHSFFDRPLYKPGQIVAIKHFLRVLDKYDLTLPRASELPDMVRLTHSGSDDQYDLSIRWLPSPSGGLGASSYWTLPQAAKLGHYNLSYLRQGNVVLHSQQGFRVEEFKVPFLTGSMLIGLDDGALEPTAETPQVSQTPTQIKPLVAPKALALDLQLNYISGGPASNWDTEVSAMVGPADIQFRQYPDYNFASNLLDPSKQTVDESYSDQVFLKQQALAVNTEGRANLVIDSLPSLDKASRLRVETGFLDPNGELQTLQQSAVIWPANLAIGMMVDSFDQGDMSAKIDLLLLDAEGQPLANHPVSVEALQQFDYAVRKRLVGGFYSYESEQRTESLGQVCDGQSDAEGKFSCELQQKFKGQIIFRALSNDEDGRAVANYHHSYFSGWGWLGSADHDRIDIVADKKVYQPGDTATLQVRMPFQKATALLAIERAGILKTQIHELTAEDPNIRLEVDKSWYPNVYASVLAVRGRVEDDGSEPQPRISGLIDLNKPSFRYGLTEIKVDDPNKQFNLEINLDQSNYQLRDIAIAKIKGVLHDGTPASRASVAIAVVDEALLELASHDSAAIIRAMRRERGYSVTTATAQSEVIGRRHYGRKAVAAGGAAADLAKRAGTREFFDTLLLWQPNIELDVNGEASIPIHLNDSISRFKVIAVGDFGVDRFAEAKAEFSSSKDLQLISGIPNVIREQDSYDLSLTLRNTTDRDLEVIVGGSSTGAMQKTLSNQEVTLAAKQSMTVSWPVPMDELSARHFADTTGDKTAFREDKQSIRWHFFAVQKTPKAQQETALSDSMYITQEIKPLIPLTVRQSLLLSLDAEGEAQTIQLGLPETALTLDGKPLGGVSMQLRSSLLGQTEELTQWFSNYPYTCYEQLAAIAVGLDDQQAWDKLMLELPQYLDSQGLVKYFPAAGVRGSINLTAYLLSLSSHAKKIGLAFEIPQAHQERLLNALIATFEGRIDQELPHSQWRWSYRLAALTALAEYGQVTPRMAQSFYEQNEQWNMSDWVNWLIITKSFNDPAMTQIASTAKVNLLSLLSREGQLLVPQANELTNTWWTMFSREANLAKLLFVVTDDPDWSADIPYLVNGLINLQNRGHWGTTVANTYAKLAMQYYGKVQEDPFTSGNFTTVLSAASTTDESATTVLTEIKPEQFEGGQAVPLAAMPWTAISENQLNLDFEGQGKLWVDVSTHAAVPLLEAKYAGYRLEREVLPVVQKNPEGWSQGDVYRVKLKIHANSPMTWVVVNDPIPSGATILGSGLGRDSLILQEQSAQVAAAENSSDGYSYWRSWPTFVERGSDSYRAYYDFMGQGETELEYTVRLNHSGEFNLPPSRVEALYNPDVYGEWPHAEAIRVEAR